jgi:hypothetical protein
METLEVQVQQEEQVELERQDMTEELVRQLTDKVQMLPVTQEAEEAVDICRVEQNTVVQVALALF